MFGKGNLVGLDIGTSSVKMAHMKETSRGVELLSFDMVALPPETVVDGRIMNFAAVVERVREMVKTNGLKGKEAALGVSGNFVIIKKLLMTEMTAYELEESLQWEAEQYIPFDLSEVNVDIQILNPRAGHGQMDVLLVAAKKEYVDEHVSVALEGGLKPVTVDTATFAVYNMFEANYQLPPGETIALINVGASLTNVIVISNSTLAFTRDLGMGGSKLTTEIQKQLNVTFEEAEQFKTGVEGSLSSSTIAREVGRISERVADDMVTEIKRSLDFFVATNMKADITRLYLTGGSAQVPALVRRLENRLGVPVELTNPFKNIVVDAKKFDIDLLQRVAPAAGVAIGLGLRKPGDRAVA